jgi:hypothetical protein
MSGKYLAIEEADRYVLPLGERRVSRIYIDFAFGIFFWEPGPGIEIRIGGRIRLRHGSEKEVIANPADPASLCPLLSLFGLSVANAYALKDGTLKVEFKENIVLQIDPDDKYEAWELASSEGLNGLKLVSLPGGRVAFWQNVDTKGTRT